MLVIVDNHTLECLTLEASSKIHGMDVVTTLERITREQDFPKRINLDNGPKIIYRDVNRWGYWNHGELDVSRPGTPSGSVLVKVR